MDRRTMNRLTVIFIAVVVLLLAVMLVNSMRTSSQIVLPGEETPPGGSGEEAELPQETLQILEIRPETVQAAVETLSRPDAYQRTIRIQQFWDGGSGEFEVDVAVRGGWTRTDRALSEDQVRHTITDGEQTYIWYNREKEIYSGPAGKISADQEQTIPTYEDVLNLPVASIREADYRLIAETVNCIYVETHEDELGYTLRYWISVDNGLLMAAERLLHGETIYRMSGLEVDLSEPDLERYLLPDDTWLVTAA